LKVTVATIKDLRDKCGAGVMECRTALVNAEGDMDKALESLRQKGLSKAAKKAGRETTEGLVEAYIHPGGRIGALIELNCETDFVARTDEFKELAHNISLQVAAMCPQCVSKDELPPDSEESPETACLLLQPFIKEPSKTIQDILTETIAKLGENIRLRRFSRFELGK
jgi:elongation factor Ts